ncbi:MoaD/ThiS family protein [Nocardia sp. NPDC058379]|uniref:MoaD/ThiS family protein n=1 Tax=unclassified Nocardia TaxID=2637762 RepID=UPI00365161FD
MPVTFVIPHSWHSITAITVLQCDAASVSEALTWFGQQYPVLRERIFTADNRLAPWTVVCLEGTDVRSLGGLDTAIEKPTELQIIPALMGG